MNKSTTIPYSIDESIEFARLKIGAATILTHYRNITELSDCNGAYQRALEFCLEVLGINKQQQ